MTRFRLASVLLLTVFAAPVLAQADEKAPEPVPLVITVLWYAEDDVLQKELKLTPAQIKDVRAVWQKLTDFYDRTTQKEQRARAATEEKAAAAALKKIFSPEQFTRAEQLAGQINWAEMSWSSEPSPYTLTRSEGLDLTRVTGVALHYSAELASTLKLTADQKKLVTDGLEGSSEYGGMVYLTPEQTAAAKAFLGPIVKHTWTMTVTADPTESPSYLGRRGSWIPGLIGLTAARDVRTAMNLTDEQTQELAKARGLWQDRRGNEEFTTEKQNQHRKDFLAESEKTLARVLKPEQLARLKQIEFQLTLRQQPRPESAPFTHSPTAKVLAITPEQRKTHDAAQKTYAEAVSQAVKADDGFTATDKAIKAASETRNKAIEAIFTPDQTKKLADLRGTPFKGNTSPDQFQPGFGGPGSGPKGGTGNPFRGVDTRVLRELSFGRYALELNQLSRNGSIQTELKLTPEQIKKASAAYADQLQKYSTNQLNNASDVEKGTKPYEERSKFVEKALGEILTPEQAKRFREIMLQERERGLSSATASRLVASAVSYPGVAESVKLSPEQKKKLIEGSSHAVVLTDEQKAAIKLLLGDLYKGSFSTTKKGNPWGSKGGPETGGGFGPGGGFAPPPVEITAELRLVRELTFGRYTSELGQLTRNAPILADLKLTPEQIQKATTLYRDQLQKYPARDLNLARSDPEKATKLYEERSKFVEKALGDILTANQAKRFREIMIQLREASTSGRGSDPTTVAAAAAYPGVADAIKVTAEQKKKLIEGTTLVASILTTEQKTALRGMEGEPVKGLVAAAPGVNPGFPPPGSGPGGGGFMGGGRGQDPEQSWALLLRLTGATGDTADLSKIPPQTHALLKAMTERTGGIPLPESGIMTKAAYLEYFAKNESARADASYRWGTSDNRTVREWTFGRFTSELSQLSRNKSIQTDLKLTPEQTKKADVAYQELLKKFPVRDLNAGTNEAKAKWFEDRSKAVEKALGEILTVDQAKRFREIMLQARERPQFVATVVSSAAAYPGVAETLKLTATQKADLIAAAARQSVLTNEQKALIKTMLGETFKGEFSTAQQGGGGPGSNPWGPGGGGPGGSPRPRVTLSPQMHLFLALPGDAMALTPEQVTKLVPAITKFQVAMKSVPIPGQRGAFQSPDGPILAEASAALNKEIEAILTPEQRTRLDQLLLQGRAARSLLVVLTTPTGAPLKLIPEQVKALTTANQELLRIAGLVSQAGLPEEQVAELQMTLRNRLDDRILAVLTAEQKAAWKELIGAPYPRFQKMTLADSWQTVTTPDVGVPSP